MKKKNKYSNLTNFFYEIGTLRKLVRAHRQTLLTDDLSDNIAAHSFRVSLIGYFLAKEEKLDAYKILLMCLLHDLPETRSGDQNWVHKKYVKVYENEIIKDQLDNLPNEKELSQVIKEYQERKTPEAKVAKDADLLDQMFLLKEHSWQGNQEALTWLKGGQQEKRLYAKSAKKIAKLIYKNKPHAWWINLWTADRR